MFGSSRTVRARRPYVLFPAVVALSVFLASCSQPPSELPAIELSVDQTLTPADPTLPGFADGEPRPVARVTGEGGEPADYVANEVWLSGVDQATLDAFIARWDATLLLTFDPATYGLTDVEPHYLLRVDTAGADTAALAANLRSLDQYATGQHRVSSAEGLELLALTSAEAAAGLDVGINWVGAGLQYTDRTTVEAPSGPSLGGVAYHPDAFGWPSHARFSEQEIGVAEAWRALELAGRLSNRVKIAILDMGFTPDDDTPAGWLAISNVPTVEPTGTENLLSCSGGNPCPWHGTNVLSAAMAVPDNAYGSAGSAGPVGDAVLVHTLYDFFTSITAIGEARVAGARIANMSYSAPVPWYLGWSVLPFEAATAAFRATGMLLFAAAGNDGRNVDGEGCTLGVCWERTWVTPCENAGVICVGGLAANSTNKAGNSAYGAEQVDIFAPYTLWLGPDPAAPANVARAISGTSFSSPFAAGVAALIWAADPSQSAGEVEDVLLTTAHQNADDRVRRHVNALAAVGAVLGNVPPAVSLSGGGDVLLNLPASFTADVQDLEDPFPCCSAVWTSDVDGTLATTGYVLDHTFTTLGQRTITISVTDSDGATSQDSVTVNVINQPPDVSIASPQDGATVFRGAQVVLRGSADDRSEPGEVLDCSKLVWTSSVAGDPFPLSGCEQTATFASNGPRTLTLTGTDTQGEVGSAAVGITVVDPPPDLPPDVQIMSPADHPDPPPPTDQPMTLSGTASDPEGEDALTYQWTIKLGSLDEVEVGDQPTVQWTPSDDIAFNQEGTYTVVVRLRVTDPGGNVGTDFVTVEWVLIF